MSACTKAREALLETRLQQWKEYNVRLHNAVLSAEGRPVLLKPSPIAIREAERRREVGEGLLGENELRRQALRDARAAGPEALAEYRMRQRAAAAQGLAEQAEEARAAAADAAEEAAEEEIERKAAAAAVRDEQREFAIRRQAALARQAQAGRDAEAEAAAAPVPGMQGQQLLPVPAAVGGGVLAAVGNGLNNAVNWLNPFGAAGSPKAHSRPRLVPITRAMAAKLV